MTASSPSSVSGAAPDAYAEQDFRDRLASLKRCIPHMVDNGGIWPRDVEWLITELEKSRAPAASREEPSAIPNAFDAQGREMWAQWTLDQRLAHIATDLSGVGMRAYRNAIDAARRLLAAAYSAPSAASPEPDGKPNIQVGGIAALGRVYIRVDAGRVVPLDEEGARFLARQLVELADDISPPIPSREDAARIATAEARAIELEAVANDARERVWALTAILGLMDLDAFGDFARKLAERSAADSLRFAAVVEGFRPDIQARDAALAAVSHPEAQTNGNV